MAASEAVEVGGVLGFLEHLCSPRPLLSSIPLPLQIRILLHFVAGAQAASHERRAMLGRRTPRYTQVVVGAGKIHMAVVACARL